MEGNPRALSGSRRDRVASRRDRDFLRQRLTIAAGLLAVLAICGISIIDPDLPWHLTAARRILSLGAVPRSDFLSWTMAGTPWVDFEWGCELIFYGLQKIGGSPALWMFRSVALFGVTLLFLELLTLWELPPSWRALAAPALAASLFPLFGLRPEIFSLLFFMIEMHLLERHRLGVLRLSQRTFIAVHAPLYALWANLHAGFAVGLLLCFCYAVGELFGGARKEKDPPVAALAGVAGFVGTFLNPYGGRIYAVLIEHASHWYILRRVIVEWTPPSLSLSYLSGYWLLTLFAFVGLLWAVRQGVSLPPEHIAAAVIFGFFGSRSIRTTLYAMLTVYPFGLAAWHRVALSSRQRRGLAAAALAAIPFIAWRGYTWAGELRIFGWPPPMEAQGPARAFAFLRREKATLSNLRLYNPYNWGGCLGYALAPDYKTFIDGRYFYADLIAQIDRASRDPLRWRSFMNDSRVELAILENDDMLVRRPWEGVGRPYVVYEWPRVEWALVYWDSLAVILVRRSAVPASWLAVHEFRWIWPFDLHHTGLEMVAGVASPQAVADEIARYRRDIGDVRESALLAAWFSAFTKDLTPRPRGAYR